jgi:hypothetical protein
MATTDFLSFIEKTSRRAIILAEVEPREAVDDWTFRSNLVYEVDWASFVQDDLVPGGLYREIVTVEEDGVALTQVTDETDLNTPGTWYFSPAADGESFKLGDKLGDKLGATPETLMVHTTDGTDPETKILMRVTFRIYLSTVGIVQNGIYYEPRLTGESLPTITQESEDLFFGIAKKVSNGNISLNNADGLFDKLAALWVWRNARVNLYIGGNDLEHQAGGGLDYVSLGQMLVESFVPTLQSATMSVRDVHKVTLRQLPPNFLSSAIYPELQNSAEGKPIPLLFGNMESATGALSPYRIGGDGTSSTDNTYVIADATLQTLYAIGSVYHAGITIGTTYLQRSLAGCTFSILAGWDPDAVPFDGTFDEVTVNATGQPILGQAWESSDDYLKGYGEIVSHLYTHILGLEVSEINAASALTADQAEAAPMAAYLTTQQAARIVVRNFERGVLGRTIRAADGTLHPTIWEPGIDSTAARSLADPEVFEFEPRRRIESVYSRVNVAYLHSPALGSNKLTFADNIRTKKLYLDDRDEELTMSTHLTTGDAAKRLADRVAFMTRNPDVVVRVVETGIRLMDQVVGDRLYLTLARAPSADGSWSSQIFEIDKIVKTLAPVPRVEVTLNNLRGIGGVVGIWTDNVVPVYPSSSSSDKGVAGWWLDEDDFADPSDAASKNASVWW